MAYWQVDISGTLEDDNGFTMSYHDESSWPFAVTRQASERIAGYIVEDRDQDPEKLNALSISLTRHA